MKNYLLRCLGCGQLFGSLMPCSAAFSGHVTSCYGSRMMSDDGYGSADDDFREIERMTSNG